MTPAAVLIAGLLAFAPASPDPLAQGKAALDSLERADPRPSRERLRTLWFLSVAEEGYLDRTERELFRLEAASLLSGPRDSAYRGAIHVVRSKHALWPPSKLEHLKRAAPLLDSAVVRSPDDPEIRYLRLMSCYYLPSFFGRSWSVDADFRALARLLPHWRPKDVSAGLLAEVSEFVLLHHPGMDADSRRLLEHRAKELRLEGPRP